MEKKDKSTVVLLGNGGETCVARNCLVLRGKGEQNEKAAALVGVCCSISTTGSIE